MVAVTIADLVFRLRQFLIAVLGTAVVLGVALVLSGLAAGFSVEVSQTVHGLDAGGVVLASSASSRLTAFTAFPQRDAALVATEPGAGRASPFLLDPDQVARVGAGTATVNLAGVVPGGIGDPASNALSAGRPLAAAGDAVVDDRLRVADGAHITIAGERFVVVGTVAGRSLLGGLPLVYVTLPAAQRIAVHGRPYVTAVLTSGMPAQVPSGLQALRPGAVVSATAAQMASAVDSVRSSEWLMWGVAVIIVAALLYVVALERRQDFAVLKALGSSSSKLFAGLVLEAVIVTVAASAIGLVLSVALTPMMSQPVDIPALAYLTLPPVAVVIGVVASLAAARRVAGADPASAFA